MTNGAAVCHGALLVTGSRTLARLPGGRLWCVDIICAEIEQYRPSVIVAGDAYGPDTYAHEIADRLGIPHRRWNLDGTIDGTGDVSRWGTTDEYERAGRRRWPLMRNERMVRSVAHRGAPDGRRGEVGTARCGRVRAECAQNRADRTGRMNRDVLQAKVWGAICAARERAGYPDEEHRRMWLHGLIDYPVAEWDADAPPRSLTGYQVVFERKVCARRGIPWWEWFVPAGEFERVVNAYARATRRG